MGGGPRGQEFLSDVIQPINSMTRHLKSTRKFHQIPLDVMKIQLYLAEFPLDLVDFPNGFEMTSR